MIQLKTKDSGQSKGFAFVRYLTDLFLLSITSKGGFIPESAIRFSNLPKKNIPKKTILDLKFQVQDRFLEYFLGT